MRIKAYLQVPNAHEPTTSDQKTSLRVELDTWETHGDGLRWSVVVMWSSSSSVVVMVTTYTTFDDYMYTDDKLLSI